MTRKFNTSLAIFFLLILAFSACTEWTEEQKKRQHLPDFDFEEIKGGELKKTSLTPDQPVTILFFDPDCSHCKETIEVLVAQIESFDGINLVLLSPADRTQVLPFLHDNGLLNRPNVKVGLVTAQEFLDTFGTTTLPTTLFYDATHDLKRAYKGPVDAAGMKLGVKMVKE